MKTFRVLTAIVLVLLSLAATIRLGFAKAPVKLVAVLELTNKAGVTDDEAEFLTNKIRNVASQKLPAGRFMIMTRENIETLLPPGTNLKKCTASECEIEVGRKLGAEYIVTGEILKFGGDLRIQVSVHHVPTGGFLGNRDTTAAPLNQQEPLLLKAASDVMDLILVHSGVVPGAGLAGSGAPAAPPAAADPEIEKRARAQQEKDQAQQQAAAERKAKLEADYAAVKAIHFNAALSAAAKKAAYGRFAETWSADATHWPEVHLWLAAADGPAGMLWVPGGAFTMGCSPGDPDCGSEANENPPHPVTVNAFWMDETPVTQAQFQTAMGANPSAFTGCPDCPAESVTWDEAARYCAKAGKRLPTEAEWEFAARGGTAGARYGEADAVAWHAANSGARTHPVAQKQPNAYGLYDMLGNVWEWCADWYHSKYYASSPADNPRGPATGTLHAMRGGSWRSDAKLVRASIRTRDAADNRLPNLGFRCVRE